ncbi:MAG TPA: YfhO family protein [Caldilineae bacterium]|nr:YfhO family protein [Caldilineae bacterium]
MGPLKETIQRRRPSREMLALWWTPLWVLTVAVSLAVLIAAAQLLPTLELTRLSIRSGGLRFTEAAAFSLKPNQLLLALFPPYAAQPAVLFGTPAFAEYLAYVGITGMILAGIGLMTPNPEHERIRVRLGALALGGLLLALGGYTPLYLVLYKALPGFALFRAPPRWLTWYALAMALLAGMGLDRVMALGRFDWRASFDQARGWIAERRSHRILAWCGGGALALLLIVQRWPGRGTVILWVLLALAGGGLLTCARWPARLRPLVGPFALVLLSGELLAAALPLDFNHPSAPQAVTSLRTAPAHLLAAPGRFLSMSGIRYDPGDLPEMRQILEGHLDENGFQDYVVAAKMKEIIAPNLPLLFHLPSIDGYDGGVLPLARYTWFQTLFIPPNRLLPDGRLREQLQEIPAHRMLDLAGIRYVITDKVRDVWIDGVYYDLQGRVALTPGQSITLDDIPDFSATAVGVVSYLEPPFPSPASRVGEISLLAAEGPPIRLSVRAGVDTAPGTAVSPTRARVAYHDDVWEVNYYQTSLPLPRAVRPKAITLRSLLTQGNWVVRGLTLIDERTRQFVALVVSPDGRLRRVHSGDVKVYELEDALGRLFVIGRARVIPDDEAAIAAIADWSFDPRREVILSGGRPLKGPARAGDARIVVDRPEEIVIEARLHTPGYLVLNDTYYPGWHATVDGRPVPILRANFLFRAIALSPGEHLVVFTYRPGSFQRGVLLSAAGICLTALLCGIGVRRRR